MDQIFRRHGLELALEYSRQNKCGTHRASAWFASHREIPPPPQPIFEIARDILEGLIMGMPAHSEYNPCRESSRRDPGLAPHRRLENMDFDIIRHASPAMQCGESATLAPPPIMPTTFGLRSRRFLIGALSQFAICLLNGSQNGDHGRHFIICFEVENCKLRNSE